MNQHAKHDVAHYKKEAKKAVGHIFAQKARAIDNMGEDLAEKTPAEAGLLGKALGALIPLGAGELVAAVKVEGLAASLFTSAMDGFAGKVQGAFAKDGGASMDPKRFCANYTALLQLHDETAANHVAGGIHDVAAGQSVVAGLEKQAAALNAIYTNAQREALDAWTQAMQVKGTKQNGKNQGYSDPSTGQLHLDKLELFIEDGKTQAIDAKQARMEKVSNTAAQQNASRALGSIPVVRTMNVHWTGWDVHGEMGSGISPHGAIASDEVGSIDKFAFASYYHHKKLDRDDAGPLEGHNDQAAINADWSKGREKLWNAIKGRTPSQLGFSMKGD